MHVLNLGNVLTMANLGAHTTSLKEMLDCLRTYIKETGVTPGTWVQGRGFNHDYFADERRFPTRWIWILSLPNTRSALRGHAGTSA